MKESKPKLLFLDIESIGVNALRSDLGRCVMFGYKWAHQPKAKVITMTKRELDQFNDKPLLIKMSAVYNEADLTIAHYGSVFDRRFLHGRLLINRLPPIPFTKMRDTCMIMRSVANFSSNRLKHLCKVLGLGHEKLESNWPDAWFQVMRGNMKALRDMAIYCKGDVMALEDLYNVVRPFDNAHPRMFSDKDRPRCPKCGGDVQYHGVAFAGQLRYKRYQCNQCGAWGRDRKAS